MEKKSHATIGWSPSRFHPQLHCFPYRYPHCMPTRGRKRKRTFNHSHVVIHVNGDHVNRTVYQWISSCHAFQCTSRLVVHVCHDLKSGPYPIYECASSLLCMYSMHSAFLMSHECWRRQGKVSRYRTWTMQLTLTYSKAVEVLLQEVPRKCRYVLSWNHSFRMKTIHWTCKHMDVIVLKDLAHSAEWQGQGLYFYFFLHFGE